MRFRDRLALAALRIAAVASLLLAPLLWLQGRRVRREVVTVAPPAGVASGECGRGESLSLLVCGESTVAGIGAPDWPGSLAGQMASALAGRSHRRVHWRALGRNGLTLGELLSEYGEALAGQPLDVLLIAVGANDAFRLTSAGRWRRQLGALASHLDRVQPDAVCLFSALPPVRAFPGLPQPLRWALGLRARLLDRLARDALRNPGGLRYASIPFARIGAPFCADGIHPSAETYSVWGAAMATAAMAPSGGSTHG